MIEADVGTKSWELVGVIQDLSLARSHEAIRDVVRHAARRLVNADGATFVIPEDGNCYYIDEDAISPLWKGSRFPLESCISGWAMRNKTNAVIADVFVDDRIPHDAYRQTFVKSLVMTPIRQSDPIGAIGVYWAHEYEATDTEVKLLQALADTTAVAMESVDTLNELEARVQERTMALDVANQKLVELSLTDELTGLRNRRGYDLLGGHEYDLSSRQGLSTAVVFVDVDGLKEVNDTLGHEEGDRLIVAISELLTSSFRNSDVVARVGGDEFAVLMVASMQDVDQAINRFNDSMSRYNRETMRPYELHASVGSAEGMDSASLADVTDLADQAMYEHKAARKRLAAELVG